MEEVFDIPPMDLKASAELEVRKLQDMVKRLEKQNEILRHNQNGGQTDVRKRDSVELEEVTLINLNDSSDDLEDSWLYESPVKAATPAQKSINSMKWTKTLSVEGLDDVRGNLIDKLDDIETQQEISKVRVVQTTEGRVSLITTPKNSLFFQPTSKSSQRNEDSPGQTKQNTKSEDHMYDNNQLDSSAYGSMDDEMDDIPQGPILRRSALAKDSSPKSNVQQNTNLFQSETTEEEPQGPIFRRSALSKNSPKSDSSSNVPQSDDMDNEVQGPILRRSAVDKGSPKTERQQPNSDMSDDISQGPILRRSALPKDVKTAQLNGSPETQRQLAGNASPGSRVQARVRRTHQTDNDVGEKSNLDTSSQSSQDDLDDETTDKGLVVRRSALALPKPSSEGLSKQLWYSGPISQMNKQKSKADSSAIRRSVSPSPDRRNKLQLRSPAGSTSGVTGRRSAGSRGSMEDLLDIDDSAPVQRRSLPQVPTDTTGVKTRAGRSDEGIRKQVPKSKLQSLQQPQGNVVARRSKLAAPSSSGRGVVPRRKAPLEAANDLDDSWKEGCY